MFPLDTNVVSELRKVRLGKADRLFTRWADKVDAATLYLSVITLHELEMGVLLMERKDPAQGALLRTWLDKRVLSAFADRILAVDRPVAQCSAKLHIPNPHPFRDGLIAATALVHSMTVVTRNVADFRLTGVPVIDPWASLP